MDRQIKYSKQREELLQLLSGVDTHPTAEWLYNELKKSIPNISLGTVYRNLSLLQELGLIQKIDVGNTTDHFDANVNAHYHFVCEKCLNVSDVHMPEILGINQMATEQTGNCVNTHTLLFYGMCKGCVKQKNNLN